MNISFYSTRPPSQNQTNLTYSNVLHILDLYPRVYCRLSNSLLIASLGLGGFTRFLLSKTLRFLVCYSENKNIVSEFYRDLVAIVLIFSTNTMYAFKYILIHKLFISCDSSLI